jgi:hypothetical protein
MFFLTMVTSTGTVSSRSLLAAWLALRVWQVEETRWFRVICMDQHHNVLTKERLRELEAQTTVVESPALERHCWRPQEDRKAA